MKKRKYLVIIILIFSFGTFLYVQPVGALTWSSENPLITSPSSERSPSIFQTSDHKIWVVWDQEVSHGRGLFYVTSSDFGISWSEEKNLTIIPYEENDREPSLTQLSNGTIMVVWASDRPPPPEPDFYLSADPLSLTIPRGSSNTSIIMVTSVGGFSDTVDLWVKSIIPPFPGISTDLDPEQLTPPPNGNANSTLTITVGAEAVAGNYTIVVLGTNEGLNKTKSVNIALTVTASTGSFSSSRTLPLSISPSNTENYEIYYKVSHDNGSSWSKAVRLTQDSASDNGPSITQASNGTIWVVWSSSRTGNYEIFSKTSSDMGASWSSATQLTSDPDVDAYPAIAQMGDGRIWVVWHSSRYAAGQDPNMEILYKIYDGLSWSDDRLTNTSKDIDDTTPAILQTADETIWVFWASEGDEQPPFILYKQSFDNGTNWSDTFEFTMGLIDKWPATTQTCDSKIWVVWSSLRDGNFEIYYKTSLIHNVAVTNLTLSQDRVYQGETVSINVTVQNRGDYNESFTVTCYANSTLIDSETVTLNSTESTNANFLWNTSGFAHGNYYVKAEASPVSDELYMGDNTLSTGPVRVKLLGDVNDDGVVDYLDICELSAAYGSVAGDSNWNEEADVNGDNTIDVHDSYVLGNNYGKTD